jgi:hypothetical protein
VIFAHSPGNGQPVRCRQERGGTVAAVLFTMDAWAGLADGTITLTFRRWKRPQAKVGGRSRVPRSDVVLAIDAVDVVTVADITDDDARRAGAADRAAVIGRLGQDVTDETEVYRVAFHPVAGGDGPSIAAQADLSADDVAGLSKRLARLDAASTHGPWTDRILGLIAEHPGVVSTTLAEAMGRDRPSFKLDVRKLKRLGLTESLEVGYRLSPRGRAYLDRTGGLTRPA